MINKKIQHIKYFLCVPFIVSFIYLCYQIYSERYPTIDNKIVSIFRQYNHPTINSFFITIYQIGGVYIAGSIVFLVLIVLIAKRYWREAQVLAGSTLGILIVVDRLLKPLFDRRRPPKPRLVGGLSQDSFPSGHATGSLVFYFYLSFVLASFYPHLTKYIYSVATLIVFLIGFSSIYTHAHWATDILAGYVFGYGWLTLSLIVLKATKSSRNNKK